MMPFANPMLLAAAESEPAPTDPLFDDVLLLLDATGLADAATILDYSDHGRAVDPDGFAGTSAAAIAGQLFDLSGGNSSILVPDSDDWRFYSGSANYDFTIEAFAVTFNALPVAGNGGSRAIVAQYDSFAPASNQRSWFFALRDVSGTTTLWVGAFASTSGGGSSLLVSFAWTPTLEQEYDLAVVRSGTDFYLFIDGALVASASSSRIFANSATGLTIGGMNMNNDGVSDRDELDGTMRALRITRAARYTDDYTVPSLPLPKA